MMFRMASPLTLGKAQLIFVLCIPLAIMTGYLLSDPLDPSSTMFVALTVGLLSIPLLMSGYHAVLIFSWNAVITPAFLPGQPYLWVPLAVLGLGFAIVNRLTSSHVRLISVPFITRPLLCLMAVVLVTAYFRGGLGLHSFGSETYGGRNYAYIFAAILGYFALSSQRIPTQRAQFFTGLFLLTGVTGLIPNLAFLGGKAWYFLFYLFPPDLAFEQAARANSVDMEFGRVVGLGPFATALFCWLLARYGIRRIFSLRHPWPFLLFLVTMIAAGFTGFRSVLLLFVSILAVQFWFEGLFKWKTVVPALAILGLSAGVLLPNADKLPLVVQRTLSIFPVRLSPVAEMSAEGSSEWRLEMWQQVLPEVPQYLLKGKGFAIDPTDLALSEFNNRFNIGYSAAIAAGDYHNGPLSLVIPLGIWGFLAFGWFVVAALRYLHRVYRYGDPELRTINTFLLASFLARIVIFTFIVGSFFSDLFVFTGIVGFSVSLNGATLPQPAEAEPELVSETPDYSEELAAAPVQRTV